jgi:hypothetical protein
VGTGTSDQDTDSSGQGSAQDSPPPPPPTPAAPVEEKQSEAFMPEPALETRWEEDLPPPKPPISRGFAPGTHEAALGLATAGSGDYFYFGASGLYAHYVIKGLAPGIEVQYAHVFSDYDYPDSLSLMPFLKYAFSISETVAPYLLLGGGRQFEWGVKEAFRAADSWFLGGGIGAHIGLGAQWAIKLQVLFLHHWYDGTKVYGSRDSEVFRDVYNNQYWCQSEDCPFAQSAQNPPADVTDPTRPHWVASAYDSNDVNCTTAYTDEAERKACEMAAYKVCDSSGKCYERTSDQSDAKREWIYPVITFGLSFVF